LVRVHVREHAEDIVRDPAVTAWLDDYAARVKALTEPEWLHIIDNPDHRWFKEKYEYKNLFTFGRSCGGTPPLPPA
jgi:hypothetical protein